MTLTEIETEIFKRLEEDPADPRHYRATEVRGAVNEGQRIFAFLSLCLETTQSFNLAVNTTFYSVLGQLPDFISPLRAGAPLRLEWRTLRTLDALDYSWRNARAALPKRYGVYGADLLYVHPTPNVPVSIELTYAKMPARMTTDAAVPELPAEYHDSLVDYGTARVRLKEGAAEFDKTLGYFDRFLKAILKMNGYMRERSVAARYDTLPPTLTDKRIRQLLEAASGSVRHSR